ncbi:MAG: sugar transferase [Flavobacteriaceae bacterium]|nr:sugar transferase [Flavobacteriaceae bacterium]
MYYHYAKPILDFILALLAFIFFFPLFTIITIGLFFANDRKVFFVQKRLGKDAKLFTIIKFKTMNDKKDDAGNLLPDEKRLTSIGKFLRATSLDELPQLINVLKGEMSLIGPRPLLPFYWDLYNDFQKRRNEVKPGITGWAQVNGRNRISWIKKFELDVWYIDHISFFLDLKILILTIVKVLKSEGINEEGQATSEEFKGNF